MGSTPTRATQWVVLLAAGCKPVVAKQVRWATRGSIPSRPTDITARWSSGRMRDSHSRGAGSIPARVTDTAKWRNLVYARHSECRVHRTCEFDPRLGYSTTRWHCRCGRCPTGFHKAGEPGSIPGSATRGWASAQPSLISSDCRVRPPDPPFNYTAEYANRQSGHVESVAILRVRLQPWKQLSPPSDSEEKGRRR